MQQGLSSAARRNGAKGRPAWMVVLASLMLLLAAQLLFAGLTILRGRGGAVAVPSGLVTSAGSETSEEAVIRDLQVISRAFDEAHPTAVAIHAVSKLALALLLLYAVAAVFSFDRRGRRATMAAAWAGIAYHIGNAIFLITVVRQGVLAAAPLLASLAAKETSVPAEDLVALTGTFMVVLPVAMAFIGIGFSVVLLAYFGGRRGRLFYGLEPPAGHGG